MINKKVGTEKAIYEIKNLWIRVLLTVVVGALFLPCFIVTGVFGVICKCIYDYINEVFCAIAKEK